MADQFSIDTVEEMWKSVSGTNEKLNILFRISLDTGIRVKNLERRKRYDRVCSTVGGFFGGIAAVIGSVFFRSNTAGP